MSESWLAEREREYERLLKAELDRLVKDLRHLGASRIVLFGSMARGRLDLFTDIDLIVVLDTTLPFAERSAWVYRQLVPRVAADIMVYTPSEFEDMRDNPFVRQALNEGVVLYEEGTA